MNEDRLEREKEERGGVNKCEWLIECVPRCRCCPCVVCGEFEPVSVPMATSEFELSESQSESQSESESPTKLTDARVRAGGQTWSDRAHSVIISNAQVELCRVGDDAVWHSVCVCACVSLLTF